MAEIKPIKDERLVKLLKSCGAANEPWSADKHCLALWKLFREYGLLKDASPEVIKTAALQWQADYSNGHFGYASNQAKHCAATGICAADTKVRILGEFN